MRYRLVVAVPATSQTLPSTSRHFEVNNTADPFDADERQPESRENRSAGQSDSIDTDEQERRWRNHCDDFLNLFADTNFSAESTLDLDETQAYMDMYRSDALDNYFMTELDESSAAEMLGRDFTSGNNQNSISVSNTTDMGPPPTPRSNSQSSRNQGTTTEALQEKTQGPDDEEDDEEDDEKDDGQDD